MGKVLIVGMGPGSVDYLLPVTRKIVRRAKTVIGSSRMLRVVGREDGICLKNFSDALDQIEWAQREGSVAVLVSGDPLMYSFTRTIQRDPRSQNWKLEIFPAIGSLQMLGAAFKISMEDVVITSIHGRSVKRGTIALKIYENQNNFFLCSKEQDPVYLANICLEYGLEDVQICVGMDLSYEKEKLLSGKPKEITNREFSSLCVAAVLNENPKKINPQAFILDGDFIRGKTPMTKEEVRILAIHNLQIQADSTVWDVGAGTGSISIEAARRCPFGSVYAVEYQEEAIQLIKRNAEWFACDNLQIQEGKAPEVLSKLPDPDCVFIGGTNGNLSEIIEELRRRKNPIRLVIAAVTMETLTEATQILKEDAYSMLQIQIHKSRELSSYHLMEPQNPVTLITTNLNINGRFYTGKFHK